MERNEIEKIIPHRPPFLWIDRVEELEPGIHCVAWLSVDAENPIFAGHFPARPILPGVLMIEATMDSALLAAVHRFKFFKPVAPGVELRIETTKLTQAGAMACIEGTVSVLGEKVASGELSVVSGR
jgi:3-hydroxyacyl-[acyl-carrier-protein] dehydratase